ncbi:hypothetical protein ABPG74_002228 [Tetrahymena malaccensis]
MSSKELKKKIQEQFAVCEQQFIKAIEHTKKRIVEQIDQFQKEKLNSINQSLLSFISQIRYGDHDKKMEYHILSSINQMNQKFPEFQKILKAQIRIPLREAMKKIEFDLPKLEILPVSFNLQHKKSLAQTSAQMAENQAINCVTSLPLSRIAAVVNTKIKVMDINQEKILASLVAHTERITSLNYFNIKRQVNVSDTISLSQKMKQSSKKANRKHSAQQTSNKMYSHQQDIQSISQRSQSLEHEEFSSQNIIYHPAEKKIVSEQVLISTSLDKRCQIMNIGDYSLINTIKLNKQGHNVIQISEREILIQQIDGFSTFIDMKKKTGEFKFTQQILRCAYSQQYRTVVLHTKNKITTINKRTMRIISTFAGPSDSFYLKVLDRQIIIIDSNGIIIQDLQNGKIEKQKMLGLQSPICSLTDLNDGSHVAVITLKNEVAIIDYLNMKTLSVLNLGGKSGARSITYMNDGQNFAINTVDNKIKLWTFSKD